MRKLILVLPTVILMVSCVSPSVEKLADEFCECRTIQQQQSSLQGEQCFQEWDKKYGKMRLNDQEELKFKQLISQCLGEEGE